MLLNALRIAVATVGALLLLVFAAGCAVMGGMRVAIPAPAGAATPRSR